MRNRLFEIVQNANEMKLKELKELAAQAKDLITQFSESNYSIDSIDSIESSNLALYFQKIEEINDVISKLNPNIQQKLQNAIKNDLTPSTFAKKLMGTEKYTSGEFQKEKLRCDAIIKFLGSLLKNSSESLELPPGFEKAVPSLSLDKNPAKNML